MVGLQYLRENAGDLSREYAPSVSQKATNWGGVSESPYKKGGTVSFFGWAR